MFFSAKRLIHRHRETRIYVTEITYSRNNEPRTIYMFIPEGDTEIEADVYSVLYKKKIRSKNQTLYHLALNKDFTLLLMVDNARGNHYVYCRLPVLKQLFHMNAIADEILSPRLEAAVGAERGNKKSLVVNEKNPVRTNERLTFIDSEVLCTHPDLLAKMVKESIVILSPYYVMELDAYTTSYAEKLTVLSRIDRLATQYPNNLLINKNSGNGYMRDSKTATSTAHENLLAAALEYPIDKSKMTIVTNDSLFAVRAEMQGLSVKIPPSNAVVDEMVDMLALHRKNSADSSETLIAKSTQEPGNLPPRSQRHRKERKQKSFMSSVQAFFYSIFI